MLGLQGGSLATVIHMAEFSEFDDERLLLMAFCSEANFTSWASSSGMEIEVSRIMYRSPRSEADDRVGGIFHCGDRFFLLCLEGPCRDLEFYFRRSEADERHRNTRLLTLEPVEQRVFREGTMSYAGLRQHLPELLLRHGMHTFNPYQFDDTMVREFVDTYCRQRELLRRRA